MNALVIGLGSVGLRHANNLSALGLSEISFLRARGLDPPGPLLCENPRFFSDLESALKEPPSFAIICTPTALHHETAIPLLERKIPLYLEKPIAHRAETGRRMQELAGRGNIPVQVGYQYRFHPTLKKVRQWIQENRLGKILSASFNVGEWLPGMHPWEDFTASYAAKKELGGGVVLTFSHEIDYMLWLLGPAEKIQAEATNSGIFPIDVEDRVVASITTQSGIPVTLNMDYHRNPPERTCHIKGERGDIFWDFHSVARLVPSRDERHEIAELPPNWSRNQIFLDSMRNFLRHLQGGEPLLCPLKEGLEALEVCDGILSSAARGEAAYYSNGRFVGKL